MAGAQHLGSTKGRWPQEVQDKVVELLKMGMSAQEVGKKVGKTRNSVLGWANRKGLRIGEGIIGGRPKTSVKRTPLQNRTYVKKTASEPKPKNFFGVTVTAPSIPKEFYKPKPKRAIPSTAKEWTERKFGECPFPFEVKEEIYSCCGKISEKKLYCDDCSKVMYQTIYKRKK